MVLMINTELSCIFLKKVKDEISAPVSMVINNSLENGIVPKSIKVTKVVPM